MDITVNFGGFFLKRRDCLTENDKKWAIKEDENVKINLFLGEDPYALGHVVIELKSKAHDVSDLSMEEWKTITEWTKKMTNTMKKVLREIVGKEVVKIYICSFNEDSNFPVHFHLIPRYECETLKGDELLFYRSKAKQIISPAEKQKIVDKLREELRKGREIF